MPVREEARYTITAEDRSAAAFRSFGGNVEGAGRRLIGFQRSAIGLLGIFGAGALVRGAQNSAAAIVNLSNRLGVSTEALTELRYVGELAGVQFNTFSTGLQRMTRRINEVAVTGKGVASEALRQLALDAEALNRLPLDQKFERIADQMAKVEDPATRVRLAMQLFDTEGVQLIQTMTNGAEGIQTLRAEAVKLGASLSRDVLEPGERADAALTRLNNTTGALGTTFALRLSPTLEKFANILTSVIGPAADILDSVFSTVGNQIGNIAASVRLIGNGRPDLALQNITAGAIDSFSGARDVVGNFGNLFSTFADESVKAAAVTTTPNTEPRVKVPEVDRTNEILLRIERHLQAQGTTVAVAG